MEKKKEMSIQVAEVLLIICLNMTKVVGSLFKRAIGYTYQQVARILITQTKPKKVTIMVGTFLNKDSDGLWISKVMTNSCP